VSVARMRSPEGWVEPGQRPDFEEITVVLAGMLRVEHEGGTTDVRTGQAIVPHRASGCATARRSPAAQSTWPSASPRSRPIRSTARSRRGSRGAAGIAFARAFA
jgi:hypothetical protein